MSMLTLYLIALGIGGAMVVITLVFGGDTDADADASFDADADADLGGGADADAGHHADHGSFDLLGGWLPITSVRFWTFFAAGFGLSGTLLTALELGSGPVIAVGSVAAGYLCGWGVVSIMRKLSKNEVTSSLGSRDYIGAAGKVVLAVGKNRTGKVRLHLAGRVLEVLAETEEDDEIPINAPVMVYAVNDEGHVVVSKSEKLPE